MAVRTGQHTLGVNVPRAGQFILVCQVQPGVVQALRGVDLPGRNGAPLVRLAFVQGQRRAVVHVNQPVTLSAVLVGRLLHHHVVGLELAVGGEGVGIPLPPAVDLLHEAGSQQGCRVCPPEFACFERVDACVVVRRGDVAQEAVHFNDARFLPVPGHEFADLRVDDVVFERVGIIAQFGQLLAVAPVFRRATAHVPCAQNLYPCGRCQIDVAGIVGRQIAIGQRVPAPEVAGAAVPGAAPRNFPTSRQRTQPYVSVKTVPGDEFRIVASAAGLHGRNRPAGIQHIFTVVIQQRKCGMKRRTRLLPLLSFGSLVDCGQQEQRQHQQQAANCQDQGPARLVANKCVRDHFLPYSFVCVCYFESFAWASRPPQRIGSPK